MRLASLASVFVSAALVTALAACSPPPDDTEDDDDLGLAPEGPDAEHEPLPGLPPAGEAVGEPDPAEVEPSGGDCVPGGLYCGGDKVTGSSKTLYRCEGPGAPTVVEKCAAGCSVNAGQNDACAPAPGSCAITAVPSAPYLKYGLHPDASNALAYLKVTAGRITQTIGNAAASSGTHAQDGVAGGRPYSAATDLSVLGMTDAEVSAFLDQLTSVGFAPYYRKPGHDGWPASEARHVHVVWVGAAMKASLRSQIRDWHVNRNALRSHTTYTFKTWTQCWRDSLWTRFLTKNPATS
ncbi:MAG: hypothetical protein JWP97_3867 [Labilithrix sp.]|nr:hypothetical protein [Labilithrix sp.]